MTDRIHDIYRPRGERIGDFREVERRLSEAEAAAQASRCLDCGIPFCHGSGCPLGNIIPEINASAAEGRLRRAFERLSSTSLFPEFTSRICPALCEGSCTRNLNDEPVMIRQCEKLIIETAFENGWVKPFIPQRRNGLSAAVIGSGPAGLYSAELLNRMGFSVTVYEARKRPGGLLRYGIPDFKLDKRIIDRRIALMEAEGIRFVTETCAGRDISGEYIARKFDCTVLAAGTPSARDLPIPGRSLDGIYFALDFLRGQNMFNSGEIGSAPISVKGKNVLVIGGGDTGSDCAGTSVRQGAASVTQIEIMPRPPESRSESTPWPMWPYMLRTSSSHMEGCNRMWNLSSKRFIGENGRVCGVETVRTEWSFDEFGKPVNFREVPGTEQILEADAVLLAMGFTGIQREGIVEQLGLELSPRNTVVQAPPKRIFAVGDCTSGPSLAVRAMADAKAKCACIADMFATT